MRFRRAALFRNETSDHGTFGRLRGNGLSLFIAEPPKRDNLPGKSCIPAKVYLVVWHHSPRYGLCYRITDVAGRTHILQHSGNVAGNVDAGLHTHTKGCQLPGLRLGWITVKGIRQRAVLNSKSALGRLVEWGRREPFELEIIDELA